MRHRQNSQRDEPTAHIQQGGVRVRLVVLRAPPAPRIHGYQDSVTSRTLTDGDSNQMSVKRMFGLYLRNVLEVFAPTHTPTPRLQLTGIRFPS